MLDDFTDSLYASKSTVAYGDSCQENCVSAVRSLEYVDPRGRLNIGKYWCCRRSIGFTITEKAPTRAFSRLIIWDRNRRL